MKRVKQGAKQRRRRRGPVTPRRPTRAKVTSSGTHKFAISFAKGLAQEVVAAATRDSRGNVSAWLAEAARERLGEQRRFEAAQQALAAYEAEYGAITEEEMAETDRLLSSLEREA